eukprot:6470916-Amphidinium_carterae.2
MAATTVGVATAIYSGKRDAAHLDTLATGMDFEDSFCEITLALMTLHDDRLWLKCTRMEN